MNTSVQIAITSFVYGILAFVAIVAVCVVVTVCIKQIITHYYTTKAAYANTVLRMRSEDVTINYMLKDL